MSLLALWLFFVFPINNLAPSYYFHHPLHLHLSSHHLCHCWRVSDMRSGKPDTICSCPLYKSFNLTQHCKSSNTVSLIRLFLASYILQKPTHSAFFGLCPTTPSSNRSSNTSSLFRNNAMKLESSGISGSLTTSLTFLSHVTMSS